MDSDINIARKANSLPISEIAKKLNIPEESIIPYGNNKAKIDYSFIKSLSNKKNGKLIFPIVSLSKKKKILKIAKKYFKNVKLLESKDWPLPKSMYSKSNLLEKLKKQGLISFKRKFGLILYTSDVYIAY